MKLLMNLLWIVFGGIFIALLWFLIGLLLFVTVFGIPFGIQCFKMGTLTLTPFGKDVRPNFEKHPIANILWIVIAGWELAILYITTGALLCVTIIGIPFGLQWFKMAVLALLPFGAEIK